jgi:hypothetical protein
MIATPDDTFAKLCETDMEIINDMLELSKVFIDTKDPAILTTFASNCMKNKEPDYVNRMERVRTNILYRYNLWRSSNVSNFINKYNENLKHALSVKSITYDASTCIDKYIATCNTNLFQSFKQQDENALTIHGNLSRMTSIYAFETIIYMIMCTLIMNPNLIDVYFTDINMLISIYFKFGATLQNEGNGICTVLSIRYIRGILKENLVIDQKYNEMFNTLKPKGLENVLSAEINDSVDLLYAYVVLMKYAIYTDLDINIPLYHLYKNFSTIKDLQDKAFSKNELTTNAKEKDLTPTFDGYVLPYESNQNDTLGVTTYDENFVYRSYDKLKSRHSYNRSSKPYKPDFLKDLDIDIKVGFDTIDNMNKFITTVRDLPIENATDKFMRERGEVRWKILEEWRNSTGDKLTQSDNMLRLLDKNYTRAENKFKTLFKTKVNGTLNNESAIQGGNKEFAGWDTISAFQSQGTADDISSMLKQVLVIPTFKRTHKSEIVYDYKPTQHKSEVVYEYKPIQHKSEVVHDYKPMTGGVHDLVSLVNRARNILNTADKADLPRFHVLSDIIFKRKHLLDTTRDRQTDLLQYMCYFSSIVSLRDRYDMAKGSAYTFYDNMYAYLHPIAYNTKDATTVINETKPYADTMQSTLYTIVFPSLLSQYAAINFNSPLITEEISYNNSLSSSVIYEYLVKNGKLEQSGIFPNDLVSLKLDYLTNIRIMNTKLTNCHIPVGSRTAAFKFKGGHTRQPAHAYTKDLFNGTITVYDPNLLFKQVDDMSLTDLAIIGDNSFKKYDYYTDRIRFLGGEDKQLSVGQIIGIVAIALIVIGVISVIVYFVVKSINDNEQYTTNQ